MMKKLLLSVITGSVILAGSTCFATVPADQLVLGGIQYGASISAVERAYGAPRKSEREMKSYGEKVEYKYGNTLEFEFVNGKVTKIKADDFSDAKTKAGIGLGMDAAALKNAYGAPDAVHEEDYIYYAAGQQGIGLKFEIKYGKVTEIKCGSLY
jgi:hypothetical protein